MPLQEVTPQAAYMTASGQVAERPIMAIKEQIETEIAESALTTEKEWSECVQRVISQDGGQFSEFQYVAVHLEKKIELLGSNNYQSLKACLLSDYRADYLAGLITIIGQ